jgi:hypothetical protein
MMIDPTVATRESDVTRKAKSLAIFSIMTNSLDNMDYRFNNRIRPVFPSLVFSVRLKHRSRRQWLRRPGRPLDIEGAVVNGDTINIDGSPAAGAIGIRMGMVDHE